MEELEKEDFEPENFVEKVTENKNLLDKLFEGVSSKKEIYRYNSFQVLLLLSEKRPEMLYQKWDFFVDLLSKKNNYHKVVGIKIIANLSKIDKENKLEPIYDEYADLIKSESIMTVRTLVENLGKIAQAKPDLTKKITKTLMNVEKECSDFQQRELIKADVIKSFNIYFEQIEHQKEVLSYVKNQLKSDSTKTRKMAGSFLKKYQ
jgi:hypothetical protein